MMKRIFEKPIKDKVMKVNYEKPKINNSNLTSNRISFLSLKKNFKILIANIVLIH